MDNIFWCKNCLNMSTRPRIKFDKNGICNACQWSNLKKTFNWKKREKILKNLLSKYKSKDGSFDCIVPVSGGKDGSYVAHQLKHKYKMNPLTVTSRPALSLEIGERNLRNFINSGYDHIHVTPNENAMRKLNKLGFIHMGFPYYGWLISIYSVIVKISAKFKIPLIFFAENGEVEYGGSFNTEKINMDFSDWKKIFVEKGYEKIIRKSKLKKEELFWFDIRNEKKIKNNKFFITWWSFFEPWDSYKNYLLAKEQYNLEEIDESNSGTFTNFAQNDQALYALHAYLMYLKFGFGRATQDAGIEIRRGAMTRDQAINLVNIYDGRFPSENIDKYLKYYQMSKKEFNKTIDKWANKKIFYKSKKGYWLPKFKII